MREGWKLVPLGDVANLNIDKVPVIAGHQYEIAGVLNAGQGMLSRGRIDGSETNYPTLHRLHADQLVMRKLTAWEGPITVVPPEYEGHFASSEFPTFTLDQEHVDPQFMRLLCQQPSFWARMKESSTGTVQRRKRVNPSQLLAISVLFPPLAEQRRIVHLIQAVDESLEAQRQEEVAAEVAFWSVASDRLSAQRDGAPFSQVLSRNIGGVWGEESGNSEIDVRVYRSTDFTKDGILRDNNGTVRSISRRQLESRSLREGDILLEKSGGGPGNPVGKVVWVPNLEHDAVCANFIQLLTPNSDVIEPRFALYLLMSRHHAGVTEEFQRRTTGIHNLQVKEYLALPVPELDRDEQVSVVKILDALGDVRLAAEKVTMLTSRLRSSLLSELLSGDYVIPHTYDALLELAS